jgi:hypothetical protein
MSLATKAKAVAALLALVLAAPAAAEEWRIVRATGELWINLPDAPRVVPVSSEETIPDGATLITGPNARVFLSRANNTVIIGPNSVVSVPAPAERYTAILQRAGVVEFEIERQKLPYFQVETPYLGALVKGTRFTVKVEFGTATVAVVGGLVEVSNPVTGELADLTAGQSAAIDANGAMTTDGEGIAARTGKPRMPAVKPLSREDLLTLQSLPKGTGPSDAGKPFDVADASAALIVSRILGNAGRSDGGQGGDSPALGGGSATRGASAAAPPPAGESSARAAATRNAPRLTLPSSVGPGDLFGSRKTQTRGGRTEPDMAMLTAGILACLAGVALLGVGFAYVRARF